MTFHITITEAIIENKGFEGWIWVLIASVPDLCTLLTFDKYEKFHILRYSRFPKKIKIVT